MKRTIAVALGLALALSTAPSVSDAQQSEKPARIAVMRSGAPPPEYLVELRRGLKELGYIEGKSYVLIPAWAKGLKNQPKIAAGLIGKVDMIVTEGTPVTKAAATAGAKAQPPIPVIFVSSGAPVRRGLVKSLSKPGGNVTGIYSGSVELLPKRMEILKQMVPGLRRMALSRQERLTPMGKLFLAAAKRGAQKLGIELVNYNWKSRSEIATQIEKSMDEKIDGWLLQGTPRTTRKQRQRIVTALQKARMPAIFTTKQFVVMGGLASYGTSRAGQYHQAAGFVDKILKGAKPADLPVERPAKFHLVINLKTAKKLGINVSPSMLLRADEVIE